MRVLVACEESQTVMKEFRKRGHDAFSCDIQPCSGGYPEFHLLGDVRGYLCEHWDLIIAHPVCRYITNSGVRWLKDSPARWFDMYQACEFFNLFLDHTCEKIAIENPIPHKYAAGWLRRKYDQIIQPWQFGHERMKATCLWLKGLPKLEPTDIVGPPPKNPELKKTWAECHRMPPGPEREKLRSKTYQGIAVAMAQQWGKDAE
jgi:hypothetical protein